MATAPEGEGATAEFKPRQTAAENLVWDSTSTEVSGSFSIDFNCPNLAFIALNK